MFQNKFVVVGVTGSIAAYKTVTLVRLLKKNGADVQVIMTKSACEFINPLTFRVVSQNPVITDMFSEPSNWDVAHVALADKADIFLVAPATANIIAKIACGIADDMLTCALLATRAKPIIVPAMNVHMYENPVTQKNIMKLKSFGYEIIEPDEGLLACGYTGKGRFPEPEDILEKLKKRIIKHQDFKNKKFLITAGPTREHIDPVRFITNHSTGKMGYALAGEAIDRGGQVILISGPTNIKPPPGLYKFVQVETTEQMRNAVIENFSWADIVIKAAAVADFKPKEYNTTKIKKNSSKMLLELEKTQDILKELGEKKTNQVLIGFAAETDNIEANAIKKLTNKNLDFIVVNNVTLKGAGFGSDTNIVKIIYKDGKIEELPIMLKRELAKVILDRVLPFM